MVEAAPELAAGGPHLRLTHQTGERDVEMVRAAYRAAGLAADVEPFLYDMGRRDRTGGPDRLPRGRDDAGGDHGGGQGGDSDSAADGDRRSPAEERRGAGGGGRRGGAAAARADRRACWRSGFWRSPRDRGAPRADVARRGAPTLARPDAATSRSSIRALRARLADGEQAVQARPEPGPGRARQDAARAFHRDRRHRHERDRRAAGQSRLRGQRIGREAVGGHRAAGDAGRSRRTTGTPPAHVGDADVVVVSSAVRPTNPEVRRGGRGGRFR